MWGTDFREGLWVGDELKWQGYQKGRRAITIRKKKLYTCVKLSQSKHDKSNVKFD